MTLSIGLEAEQKKFGNRKAAEKMILELVNDIDPSGDNAKIYLQEIFPSKDDKAFDVWMANIEIGKEYLPMYYPNMTHSKITTKNNIRVAKKWGVNFFQRVRSVDSTTGQTVLSVKKRPIFWLPVKRLAQTLEKKRDVAEDNYHTDELSGQVMGDSKASSVSNPEIIIYHAGGFDKMLTEWLKYRGGDQKGYRLMERMIAQTGHANSDILNPMSGQNKAAVSISTFLKAMHIDNNLENK